MDKRRGACITIFCQNLCLAVPKKLVEQPFSVSEKIGFQKNLRTIRGFHFFLLTIFCLTVPKNFVADPFRVSEKFLVSKILMDKRRGAVSQVFVRYLSHSTKKNLRRILLCFRKSRLWKKFTQKKWISLFSAINFLSHIVQKSHRGTHLCFRKLRLSKKFMDKRRRACITIFVKVCVSQSRKIPYGNPSLFQKK